MNIIITTFFTNGLDPQRHIKWNDDDFSIIKDFYDSVVKLNLNCLILIDNSSDSFIKKYECDNIKFQRVNTTGLNLIDIRWQVYNQILKNNKYDFSFFLDISDIIILKDPFPFLNENYIYCGDEPDLNINNDWMIQRYNMLKNINIDNESYINKIVLNAGILGGHYNNLIDIIDNISNILSKANVTSTTIDMCVFNHVLRNSYKDEYIIHGLPVNTIFRANDIDNKNAWFKHK